MALPWEETPVEDLFSAEEIALIQRVRESGLWQSIRRAMELDRETLLSTKTTTTDETLLAWGAVQQITRWLNSGPTLVVYSDRLRREESKNDG